MRPPKLIAATCAFLTGTIPCAPARAGSAGASQARTEAAADPAKILVDRLDLERYKATIKGLTQFGDRRQGTDRNRAAVDWIEARLRSYGCTNTERILYTQPDPAPAPPAGTGGAGNNADSEAGPAGSRRRGYRIRDFINNDPMKQPDLKLRELDSQLSTPGQREEVYCTKIGATHPEEMYIVSAH